MSGNVSEIFSRERRSYYKAVIWSNYAFVIFSKQLCSSWCKFEILFKICDNMYYMMLYIKCFLRLEIFFIALYEENVHIKFHTNIFKLLQHDAFIFKKKTTWYYLNDIEKEIIFFRLLIQIFSENHELYWSG